MEGIKTSEELSQRSSRNVKIKVHTKMNLPLWKIHWRGKKIKQSSNWSSLNTPSLLHVHPHSALWIVSATSVPNGHSFTECHSGSRFAWKCAKTELRKNVKKIPILFATQMDGCWRMASMAERYNFIISSSYRPCYWITCLIACFLLFVSSMCKFVPYTPE